MIEKSGRHNVRREQCTYLGIFNTAVSSVDSLGDVPTKSYCRQSNASRSACNLMLSTIYIGRMRHTHIHTHTRRERETSLPTSFSASEIVPLSMARNVVRLSLK